MTTMPNESSNNMENTPQPFIPPFSFPLNANSTRGNEKRKHLPNFSGALLNPRRRVRGYLSRSSPSGVSVLLKSGAMFYELLQMVH